MKTYFNLFIFLCISSAAFAQTFTLKSNELGGQFTNQFIASSFGCNGDNRSPELHWDDAPEGTQSFSVTMYDPDAPTGSGFWHWVIVDIPASVHQLLSGAGNVNSKIAPAGSLQSITDLGTPGYQGPCPGVGEETHHYLITVYALKTAKLGTSISTTAAYTGFLLGKQLLGKASLMVYFKR